MNGGHRAKNKKSTLTSTKDTADAVDAVDAMCNCFAGAPHARAAFFNSGMGSHGLAKH